MRLPGGGRRRGDGDDDDEYVAVVVDEIDNYNVMLLLHQILITGRVRSKCINEVMVEYDE